MKTYRELPAQSAIPPVSTTYAATALGLSKLAVATVGCHLDVPYGPLPEHRLDIFVPDEAAQKRPVYLNIHGGNWSHGFKEWLGFGAIPLTQAGAVYVSIEYRLSGVAKFPAALHDCLQAIAWVQDHIGQYGGDPDRLFVGGHSAGAHLAALATLRRDLHPAFGLRPGAIKACLPFSGMMDLRHAPFYGTTPTQKPIDAFLASQQDAADASPICHVGGNAVPFFVSWAERDAPLMQAQGAPFVMALREAGSRVESHIYPGFDHFHIHLDQLRPDNLQNRVLIHWMFGDPAHTPLPGET